MAPDDPHPPLRRDAQRNLDALLAAARALIAERGLDVGHADIARRAGVGMGTAYRHFPERAALIEALFAEHIQAVVECAEEAGRCDSGWEGLSRFMERQLEMQASNRGLRDLLRDANSHPALARRARERIAPVVRALVDRAQAQGDLAAEVTEGDFVLVQLMITGVMDASDAEAPDLWRRALAVALRGLRSKDPLPGAALTAEVIDRVQGTGRDAPSGA